MLKMMLITLVVLCLALFAHASAHFPSFNSLRIPANGAKIATNTLSTNDRWGSMTYGRGLREEQAVIIMNYITQAVKKYEDDMFNNAVFIQDAIEKD